MKLGDIRFVSKLTIVSLDLAAMRKNGNPRRL